MPSQSLKYKREAVLEKLIANRAKHKTDYDEAVEGWKEAFIKEATETLKLAKAGTKYRRASKLTKPTEHLEEYDRAIAMFEMTSQEEIELSEREFVTFVMDKWDWSGQFETTSAMYKSFSAKR